MNQLLDNSTFLEVGEFLVGKTKHTNEASAKKIIDNLLIILHALLVSDEVHFIGDKNTKVHNKNEGVDYLFNKSEASKLILPLKYDRKTEDAKVLTEARTDVLDYMKMRSSKYEESLMEVLFKTIGDDIDIVSLMKGEVNTYLNQGLKHYWNNIGVNPSSSTDAVKLYKEFDKLFGFTEENVNVETLETTYMQVIRVYEDYYKRNYNKAESEILDYPWLPLLSHTIRSQYYITLAAKESVIYNPLGTRKIFSKALLEAGSVSKTNQVRLVDSTIRMNCLGNTLLYVLYKSHFERENFLKTLLNLKHGSNNPVSEISIILKDIIRSDKFKDRKTLMDEIKNDFAKVRRKYQNYQARFAINTTSGICTQTAEEKARLNAEDDRDNDGTGIIQIPGDINAILKQLPIKFFKN